MCVTWVLLVAWKDLQKAGWKVSEPNGGVWRGCRGKRWRRFLLRDNQFCEQYFQKQTTGDDKKKRVTDQTKMEIIMWNVMNSQIPFYPSTSTKFLVSPKFFISPLLVFLVWDFFKFGPVTTGLATSAVPLDAVLSASSGATVVGFSPPLAAGLFGQNKAKNKTKKKQLHEISMQLTLWSLRAYNFANSPLCFFFLNFCH